jgi:hypothetical protein
VTAETEPTPGELAVRAFRTRLAGAAVGALVLTFVLLVWAGPNGRPVEESTGPTTSLTVPPPETAVDPPADPAPTEAAPDPTPEPTEEEVAPPPEPEPEPDEPAAAPEVEPAPDAAPPTHPPGPGDPLWGRWYRAVHLRQGDQTAVVAGDHPLYVGFLRDPDRDAVVWLTSCNTFGAHLTVEDTRLRLTEPGGSAADCDDELQAEQEVWLAELFTADPHWRRAGQRLRLWVGDRRIDLVEDARGPGEPWT